MEVWNGIKSYVSTIIKKIDRDIGIAPDLARVSIIQVTMTFTGTIVEKSKKLKHSFLQYSADTKTVVPIGNELIAGNRRTLLEIIDELQMDDFVAQVIFM